LRKRFEIQYELGATPIERLRIPPKSRDELPPVLRALQYIYTTPELNQRIFELLEAKVISGKKPTGRPGMSLWEILVMAVIRLARDADYDHLHYMATTDNLIRGLLGACKFGETQKAYSLQSIKDNVGLIDEETLNQINELVVQAGHQLLKKKDEKLNVKIDTYVLESNVHFPTDVNLLFDAARKSIEYARRLASEAQLGGWRKSQYWINQLNSHCRKVGKLSYYGGKNKQQRLKQATDEYLKLARQLSQKLDAVEADFRRLTETSEKRSTLFEQLFYFKEHLDKHIDLISRRILAGEQIPHSEKVFSLFEPYTEWIKKGKAGNRPELGLKIAVATDQFGFILLTKVTEKQHDKDIAVPMAKQILQTYEVQSMSFDKNFWTPHNHESLSKLVPDLVMPKKGKRNQQEYEREHSKTFIALRKQHSAVESAINCLEHHGLNRCPDKGLSNFKKYTGLGVLACNLHKLGNILQQKQRKLTKNRPLKKAA
jgi:hypothetical protein